MLPTSLTPSHLILIEIGKLSTKIFKKVLIGCIRVVVKILF